MAKPVSYPPENWNFKVIKRVFRDLRSLRRTVVTTWREQGPSQGLCQVLDLGLGVKTSNKRNIAVGGVKIWPQLSVDRAQDQAEQKVRELHDKGQVGRIEESQLIKESGGVAR